MRRGVRRVIAHHFCNVLRFIVPTKFEVWIDALRVEVDNIADDNKAMLFAFEGFCGFLPRIIFAHFQTVLLAISGNNHSSRDTIVMGFSFNGFRYLRVVGIISVVIAVLLGLTYMAAAGAPFAMLASNFGALLLGLAALALSVRTTTKAGRWAGAGTLVMAAILLFTSVIGDSVEGAKRWVLFGPFYVQTSLLFLPLMVINFAQIRNAPATLGMAVAALAFALQPDRAMAAALLAGLTGCALIRFDRFVGIALLSAGVAFLVTLLRPDTLPAAPFVDQILYTAFDVHFLAGAAVVGGSAMLLVPAIVGRFRHSAEPAPYFVFGLVWLAIILAAAIGNYPTPVVGYGSSAIIGYLLSLSALPKHGLSQSRSTAKSQSARDVKDPRRMWRTASLSVASVFVFGMSSTAGQETTDDCARQIVQKVEAPNTIWEPGADGEQVPLWPEDVAIELPDYDGNPEMTGSGSPLIAGRTWNWATYISQPTMTVYPPKGESAGAAMLVLPGGGYVAVAMDLEGTEICDWITTHGVTCVVLKYRAPQSWRWDESGVRLPPEGDLLPVQDAQRALGLLRSGASSYDIDPEKIGVIGFSAGAHLAAAVSNANERTYDPIDAADKVSARPNFAIVMYPGKFMSERRPEKLALGPWMKISAAAPPTLLIHAMNDATNDIRNSMAYALALNDVGVPVDMRIFAKGCHAFGLRPTSDPITTQWPRLAVEWLQNISMLD